MKTQAPDPHQHTNPKAITIMNDIINNDLCIGDLFTKSALHLRDCNYLPENLNPLLKEYKEAQEALIKVLDPYSSTKWLRDMFQWSEIIQVQQEYGTSAASSKSKIALSMYPKTGKTHYHKLTFERMSNASEARAKEIQMIKNHLHKYRTLRSKIFRAVEQYYRCKRADDVGKQV
jgi:hypothetical protein